MYTPRWRSVDRRRLDRPDPDGPPPGPLDVLTTAGVVIAFLASQSPFLALAASFAVAVCVGAVRSGGGG